MNPSREDKLRDYLEGIQQLSLAGQMIVGAVIVEPALVTEAIRQVRSDKYFDGVLMGSVVTALGLRTELAKGKKLVINCLGSELSPQLLTFLQQLTKSFDLVGNSEAHNNGKLVLLVDEVQCRSLPSEAIGSACFV